MAKVVEGYLVKSKYRKGDNDYDEKEIGVAFSEYDARDIMDRDATYYNESPFDYSRYVMSDVGETWTVVFKNKSGDETIYYKIEKCLVISGV